MTALGFSFSLVKSDRKAYDKGKFEESPIPVINWETITRGIDFIHPPIVVTKIKKNFYLKTQQKLLTDKALKQVFYFWYQKPDSLQ